MINYSPKPRSAYRWESGGHSYGPATSRLLDTPETWNLAYLSHDFESQRSHPDPGFTTFVRKTVQARLDGTGPDSRPDAHNIVGTLLQLPAPRFVHLIRHHSVLPKLPMFLAYGQGWLETMDRRSRICMADGYTFREPLPHEAEEIHRQFLAAIKKAKSA